MGMHAVEQLLLELPSSRHSSDAVFIPVRPVPDPWIHVRA